MRQAPGHRGRPRGFTIAELLVVIGVVMVLIGISLPALRGARITALEHAVLAHQRQSGLSVQIYTNDHAGKLPSYSIPGTDHAPLKYHHGEMKGRWIFGDEVGSFWSQHSYWAYYMEGIGYDTLHARTGPEFSEEHNRNASEQARGWDWMTAGAFAAPHYFSRGQPQRVRDLGGQRITITRHPSQKTMLMRWNIARYRQVREGGELTDEAFARIPMFWWFTDGHSAMHAPDDLRPGVDVEDGWNEPGVTTEDGLHGRDL
jgi:competence protein ComGC